MTPGLLDDLLSSNLLVVLVNIIWDFLVDLFGIFEAVDKDVAIVDVSVIGSPVNLL